MGDEAAKRLSQVGRSLEEPDFILKAGKVQVQSKETPQGLVMTLVRSGAGQWEWNQDSQCWRDGGDVNQVGAQ